MVIKKADLDNEIRYNNQMTLMAALMLEFFGKNLEKKNFLQ